LREYLIKKPSLKKNLYRISSLLGFILLPGILLSYLSIWVNPGDLWFLSIFGLFYPYFLVGNLILFVYWIFRNKKFAFLILIVILLGSNHIRSYYQWKGPGTKKYQKYISNKTSDINTLKVLTYNVRLFNFYQDADSENSYNEFIQLIVSQNPDVICLQEVLISKNSGITLDRLKRDFRHTSFTYYKLINNPSGSRKYGNVIFSKYPIINKGEVAYNKTYNRSIFADLLINNDTLRIYNNHLQSFNLGSQNFSFLTDFEHNFDEDPLDEIQDISFRMKAAYIQRAMQANQLKKHISQTRLPVIVCGDFNDTPVSYVYYCIKKDLKDAFVESGRGFGKTYDQIFPAFRIDYILHSKELYPVDFKTLETKLSDHYPVVSNFAF